MKHYEHTTRKTKDLIPYVNNSRTHSEQQVKQIASSMKEFGFTNPVLIDEKNGVVAGHGRLLAAEKLGMDEVPCVILSGLTEAQKKAYVIADNQLGLNSGWDMDMLKLEVETLGEMDFDLDLLGFEDDFIQTLQGVDPEDSEDDDEGIDYEEKFSVVVTCKDEIEQQVIFDKLIKEGYECKVLVN